MTLTDDEAADLRNAFDTGWLTLYAHVTELVSAYHAQGLVWGDLMHDGTIRAQLEPTPRRSWACWTSSRRCGVRWNG